MAQAALPTKALALVAPPAAAADDLSTADPVLQKLAPLPSQAEEVEAEVEEQGLLPAQEAGQQLVVAREAEPEQEEEKEGSLQPQVKEGEEEVEEKQQLSPLPGLLVANGALQPWTPYAKHSWPPYAKHSMSPQLSPQPLRLS